MKGRASIIVLTLSLCLAGCDAATENGSAGNDNEAAANGTAPPGNAAAEAAGGPCPFETRNPRAVAGASPAAEGGQQVTISIEIRPDSEGRQPMMSQRLTPPPELVLDIDRDPMATPSPEHEWGEVGIGGYPAAPAYTHAIIRCTGTQIARVPIRR